MNTIQIIIIVALFVAPALKQIYDQVKERAEVERRKREQQRAHETSLRTGPQRRPSPTTTSSQPPARESGALSSEQARLKQLEMERERRLRELRRVARQRAQRTQQPQAQAGSQAPQRTPATTRRTPQRSAQPTASSGRLPTPFPQRRAAHAAPQRPARRQPQPTGGVEALGEQIDSQIGVGSPYALRPVGPRTTTARVRLGQLKRADLRRAFVLSEVLSPPVATRKRHLEERDDAV